MKEVVYQVKFINGYIGGSDRIVAEFYTAAEAKEWALRSRRTLSPGERSYYKCSYRVVKVTKSI
jgi:hypothetical protein